MKRLLKFLASVLARVMVMPLAYPIAWLGRFDTRHLIFQFGSHLMSLAPGLPGVYLRREYYRVVLNLKSKGFVIEFGTILAQRGISIGDNVYIGPFCNIGLSEIHNDVLIGSSVHLVSGAHVHTFDRIDIPIRQQPTTLVRISVGQGCWIGNQAIVLASLTEGCVVGAGAVVTKSYPPYSVVAGNPACLLRSRVPHELHT